MSKKKEINKAFLERTIEVLDKVLEEFDVDDAEHDEGLLRTAFSTLMKEDFMSVALKGFGVRDLLAEVLGEHASDDLIYRAETFDNLLDTYGGEPSDEDMEDAREYLEQVVDDLKKRVERVKKKQQEEQPKLWNNP